MTKVFTAMPWLTLFLCVALLSCKTNLTAPDITFTGIDNGLGFIQFEVQSYNASSYLWDFGDSTALGKEKNAGHSYRANGTYLVTLQATGPWGTTSVKNNITVTGARGQVMFWMAAGNSLVDVYVDDVKAGIIYNFFAKEPLYCGTNGCAQANNLKEGEHTYSAREEGASVARWTGTIKAVGGQCIKVKLPN